MALMRLSFSLWWAPPALFRDRVRDGVQALRGVQQVGLTGGGRVERALCGVELARDVGRALPQRVPETLSRMHGQAGTRRDRPLARRRKDAERHRTRTRASQQLADGHRPLRLGPRAARAAR